MDDNGNTNENSSEEFLMSDLVTIMYKSYKNYLIYRLTDLNITFAQIPFILELMHIKKASQDDLAKKLFLTRGTTAKTLRKLDDEKIIERKTAANNRRKYEVYLTEKGKETALKIEEIDKSWEDMILSNLHQLEDFKDEDREKVTKFLKALAKGSMEIFAQERQNLGDFDYSDSSNDKYELPPFSEFSFRSHYFRGPGLRGDFFRKKGHRGHRNRDNMKKL